MKKTFQFISSFKRIRYQGKFSIKEIEGLYTENYKASLRIIK